MEAGAAEDRHVLSPELHGGQHAAPGIHDQDEQLAAPALAHLHPGQSATMGASPGRQWTEYLRGK